MAPKTFYGRLFCMFYALFGIPLNILALKSIGEFINEGLENAIRRMERKLYRRTRKHLHQKVFFCSSLLVLLTLLLGGFLYKSEGWSYFDGVYYSFIGLSNHCVSFGMIERQYNGGGQNPHTFRKEQCRDPGAVVCSSTESTSYLLPNCASTCESPRGENLYIYHMISQIGRGLVQCLFQFVKIMGHGCLIDHGLMHCILLHINCLLMFPRRTSFRFPNPLADMVPLQKNPLRK